MIVTAHTPEDWEVFRAFAARRGYFQPEVMPSNIRVIGAMLDGQLVAVVEFAQFLKRTCHVHGIGQLTPNVLRAMFQYAFGPLGMVQLFGAPASDNTQLLSLLRFLGFEELYRVKGGWDEFTDTVVMGMHITQCRWLKVPVPEKEIDYV